MENIESIEVFEERAAISGLGKMTQEDLLLVKQYYDGAASASARLFDLVTLDDEPASTFTPGWVNPMQG